MKRIVILWLGLMAMTLDSRAQFKMPKKVHRMAELDQAKAEAIAKGRPITFIYTHEESTCGLCAGSSLNAADVLGRKTVVVYADSKTDWDKLPPAAQSALRTEEAGKFIPKTVVLDAALSNVLAIVPYARPDEQGPVLKAAMKKLASAPAPSPAAPSPLRATPPVAGIPLADDREQRVWTSVSGASLEAALVQEKGGVVTLRKGDGVKVEIPVTKLSSADNAYLQALRTKGSTVP